MASHLAVHGNKRSRVAGRGMAGNRRPRDDRRVSTSHTGKLLVASPALDDPNFARTVVLMCMHDTGGAMGVVVNRPLLENRLEDQPGPASSSSPIW